MTIKRKRYYLPSDLTVEEARIWCEENCRRRWRVRNPGTNSNYLGFSKPYKPFVQFQSIEDAMTFKLQWI